MPNSGPPCPPTGQLAKPIIIRGKPPPRWHPPPHTRWAAALNLGRQNPAWWDEQSQEWVGGWMLVARITHGGWKERTWRIQCDRQSIERWVRHWTPLEKWELRVTTAEGWVKELYLRFLFTMTQEELVLELKRRREHFEHYQQRVRERKAERELEARLRAEREERELAARAERTAARKERRERERERQRERVRELERIRAAGRATE